MKKSKYFRLLFLTKNMLNFSFEIGFQLTIPILKKHNCPTLYNVQLAFDKDAPNKPSFENLLRGRTVVAHVYVERINMAQVEPTFEYLYDLYKLKDAIQDSFHTTGNFYEGRGENPIKGIKMGVRREVCINSICWFIFIFCCIIYNAIQLILAGRVLFLVSTSSTIVSVCKYTKNALN
jgi:hypothetical protein